MISFAADENFNNDIIRGLVRRLPEVDVVRIQDAGLTGSDDSTVLSWAAEQGRILLTHDVTTITKYAYERVVLGKAMPGVFEVPTGVAVRAVIDDLVLVAMCTSSEEWQGQVRYLPLR